MIQKDKIRKELEQQLEQLILNSRERIEWHAQQQKYHTRAYDFATLYLEQMRGAPSGLNWDGPLNHITQWNQIYDQTTGYLSGTAQPSMASATAFFPSITTSGTIEGNLVPDPPYTKPSSQPLYSQFQESFGAKLLNYYQQPEQIDQVCELIEDLRLDRLPQGKDAVRQFKAAWIIHQQFPPSPTASLIPMREAIDNLKEALRRCRPTQKTNEKDHIKQIGEQLAAAHASPETFEELSQEYKLLHGDLSASKQPEHKQLGRTDETRLMQRATLFITWLLSSIDCAKFRKF